MLKGVTRYVRVISLIEYVLSYRLYNALIKITIIYEEGLTFRYKALALESTT